MMSNLIPTLNLKPGRAWPLASVISLVVFSVIALTKPAGIASTSGSKAVSPAAGDTCAAATIINPATLPFAEDSTLAFAANDIDPGISGCAPGAGNDVVYSFTPAATDVYTIGATPMTPFDISLYIVTDCSNPTGTCVAGTNAFGLDRGEFLTPTLNAGTRYFIVVDTPGVDNNAGGFHFSLRRGRATNDTCATAAIIDPSRLPFLVSATTFGAANDVDPGTSCFSNRASTRGPDVVYQFTPADTQLYIITVTPFGRYDTSVYVTTDCSTVANCSGSDFFGPGNPETVRRNLNAGTTYLIVVDGFGGEGGDFTFSLQPSNPHPPSAPSDLTATAVSTTEIDLTWKDNSSDEQGFRIQRSLDGSAFTEIAIVGPNVTTFNDTTVTANTLFFYRVFAFNGLGTSDPSNIAFAQTPPNPVPVNPVIVVNPASLDFGSVRITQSSTMKLTITNAGSADLILSDIGDPALPFSFVSKPALPLTLTSNQGTVLSVRFSPTALGNVSGVFTISSNDPNTPLVNVGLTGVGAPRPVAKLQLTPAAIEFGTTTTPRTIEAKNVGEADLVIASIIPPLAPFGVTGSITGTYKPGESKTLTATFSPTTVGVFTSTLNVISNDADSQVTVVPFRGTSLTQTVVPVIVGLEFRKQGLRFQAAGSNVVAGATLIVDGRETFTLELNGDLWVVFKSSRSTPGNLRPRDIFVSPSTHTVVVKNPNGATSATVTISV
ncbi:MAG TPA: choice-of-anchor D domain-containing protein [Blastocatellia bacterium]